MEYWTHPGPMPRAELLKCLQTKQALICMLTDKVDEELLRAAPKLRMVATVSVGYDNIDLDACVRHHVVAANTPGVLDETTADFAWTLLMAIARRLVEGDAWTRSGTWPGWDLRINSPAPTFTGRLSGIIGFRANTGQRVARRAQGFQMRVLYSNRSRAPQNVESDLRAEFVDRDRLLREAGFL